MMTSSVTAVAMGWMRERFGGITASNPSSPGFEGYYRMDDSWVRDESVLIFSDWEGNQEELEASLATLYETLDDLYRHAGRQQEEFWITANLRLRFVPG